MLLHAHQRHQIERKAGALGSTTLMPSTMTFRLPLHHKRKRHPSRPRCLRSTYPNSVLVSSRTSLHSRCAASSSKFHRLSLVGLDQIVIPGDVFFSWAQCKACLHFSSVTRRLRLPVSPRPPRHRAQPNPFINGTTTCDVSLCGPDWLYIR